MVQYIKGKPKITKPFIKDPNLHLIIICHRKVNQVMKNIDRLEEIINIKYTGRYVIIKDKHILLRGIKEII